MVRRLENAFCESKGLKRQSYLTSYYYEAKSDAAAEESAGSAFATRLGSVELTSTHVKPISLQSTDDRFPRLILERD